MVKEGQLLFQLDPKPFKAQLEAARGELQSQQARLRTAEANLKRVKPLTEQDALSQADLDRAQGEFDASKAAVFVASAKVKEAELNLGYTTIRSPCDGLTSRSLQREGALCERDSGDRKPHVRRCDRSDLGHVQRFTEPDGTVARRSPQRADRPRPRTLDYEVESRPPGRDTVRGQEERSTLPIHRSARTPAPSWCARCCRIRRGNFVPGMFVTAYLKGAVRPKAIVVPQLSVQQGSNGHVVYHREAGRHRGSAASGSRRLRRRERHRDRERTCTPATGSWSTAC